MLEFCKKNTTPPKKSKKLAKKKTGDATLAHMRIAVTVELTLRPAPTDAPAEPPAVKVEAPPGVRVTVEATPVNSKSTIGLIERPASE